MRRRSGFTAIELVVTIVIVAVLTTIAVPSLVRLMANLRLQGAGNELVSDLHYARSEAHSRNVPVRLVTKDDGSGWAVIADGPGAPLTLKWVAVPAGVTLSASVTVAYEPLRTMADADATLQMGNSSGSQLRLVAAGSGQVQACSPDGSLSSFARCPS